MFKVTYGIIFKKLKLLAFRQCLLINKNETRVESILVLPEVEVDKNARFESKCCPWKSVAANAKLVLAMAFGLFWNA